MKTVDVHVLLELMNTTVVTVYMVLQKMVNAVPIRIIVQETTAITLIKNRLITQFPFFIREGKGLL